MSLLAWQVSQTATSSSWRSEIVLCSATRLIISLSQAPCRSVRPFCHCECPRAYPHRIHGLVELLVEHSVRVKPDCRWWPRCPQLPEDRGNGMWLA
eukprot:5379197-Pyramimonas_sp.AAC.1